MQCPICCDARLTPTSTVECGSCGHTCCKSCVKRFLLDSMEDPHCMKCRRVLTHTELVEKLPRTFVDRELKRHREAVLADRQKAMIPATQDAVVVEQEKRRSFKRIRDWTEQRESLKRKLRELNTLIHHEYVAMSRRESTTERRQFIMRCAREGCRGFLTEQYKCSVCEGVTCSHCHVFKTPGAEHECRAEDVATVELLRRDSKRCPACSTWIHRYEGCTQMFCTNPECHTLFDYRTLRILGERDHVHNPHYTEWLAQQRTDRRAGREAGDIPCGGMPHIHELHRALVAAAPTFANRFPRFALASVSNGVDPVVQQILLTHRMVVHAEHDTMERYRPRVDEPELQAMRVQFCLGDFDEAAWRTRLQRREKDRTKRHEVFLVLEMVVHACGDLFRQMMLASPGAPERSIASVHADVQSVLTHANAALCRVATTFACSVPFFELGGSHVVSLTHQMAKDRMAQM